MASGRPAVSTDVGDVKWAVADANKEFVASATDEEGYRSALRRLLEDPDLRARLGAANLERARRDFRHDDMVRSYLRLYEEAIAAGG
jgi:glycosyltransferase involved in cell wall biosynthesis